MPRATPFPFERSSELDAPRRRRLLAPERVIAALELGPHSEVLDFGAGTGHFALALARHLEALGGTGRVCALDIQPRMMATLTRRARRQGLAPRLSSVAVASEGGPHLPLPDNAYDRVLMANVFFELHEPVATLRELARVLRPGGRLLVLDWERDDRSDCGPAPALRGGPEEVEEGMKRAGFEEVRRVGVYEGLFSLLAFN